MQWHISNMQGVQRYATRKWVKREGEIWRVKGQEEIGVKFHESWKGGFAIAQHDTLCSVTSETSKPDLGALPHCRGG
jgi:hypothetical protein